MQFPRLMGALFAVALTAGPALAADMGAVPPVTDAATQKECGGCHLAYPPAFLSAESWTKLMGDLSHHFGADASLPEPTRAAIAAYYVASAGKSQPGVLRIDQQSWWLREHRAVGQAKFAEAKSKANCGACHSGADRGQFRN